MLKKNLLPAIILLSVWWTMVVGGVFIFYNQGGWGWLGCIFVLSIFISLLWLVLPRNFRYLLFALIIFPLAIPGFLELESQVLFGASLSYSSVLAILNTYGKEVYDFVGNFGIKCWLPLLWLLFCLLSLFLVKIDLGLDRKRKSALFCLCVIIVLLSGFGAEALFLKFRPLYQAVADWIDFQKRSANLQPYVFDGITDLSKNGGKKLYVVVIGESVWRGAMSVYGYELETTPFMKKTKDELYIFNDVVSTGVTTQVMLNEILNFDGTGAYEGNIIDFFKSAGFKTYWLSAHARYGLADRYAHLVNHADYIKYINEQSYSQDLFGLRLDDELLPEMEKILADGAKDKIVFVHLLGSHNNRYAERYPENYRPDDFGFKRMAVPLRFIEYLKSIYFTDQKVLEPLFEMVRRYQTASSYILYLSDHADDVSEKWADEPCFCHFEATDKRRVYEIPFVLWLSEKYKRENAAYVKDFASYVNRPYESGDLIYSILDLSRLSHEKIDVTKSVFNQNFRLRKRAYDSMR